MVMIQSGMGCNVRQRANAAAALLKNPPPWFSVDLPSSTTDNNEACLCMPTNSPGQEKE